jgi:hypothetical protein
MSTWSNFVCGDEGDAVCRGFGMLEDIVDLGKYEGKKDEK